MDDEYDEEVWVEEEGFPWSWQAAAVMVAHHTAVVMRAGASLIDELAGRLAADHNYRVTQREFQNEVAQAIEAITSEE